MARKSKKGKGGPAGGARRAVRRLSETFDEWRFEPKPSQRAVLGALLLWLGGVFLGVASYAQFFHGASVAPLPFPPAYLMALGGALVLAYILFGSSFVEPLYVSVFGIGREKNERVERTPWYLIRHVHLDGEALRLSLEQGELVIDLRRHGAAARYIAAEAGERIAKRVELDDEDLEHMGRPDTAEGERFDAEPPQVTNLVCRNSDVLLTFEKDVRMCARCGAFYHKDSLPGRCGECGKKLAGRGG